MRGHDAKVLVTEDPIAVYVEQVYPMAAFAGAGDWELRLTTETGPTGHALPSNRASIREVISDLRKLVEVHESVEPSITGHGDILLNHSLTVGRLQPLVRSVFGLRGLLLHEELVDIPRAIAILVRCAELLKQGGDNRAYSSGNLGGCQ